MRNDFVPIANSWNIAGKILTIRDTVMGLTLIAAGNSVPDAVASLKVIEEGSIQV